MGFRLFNNNNKRKSIAIKRREENRKTKTILNRKKLNWFKSKQSNIVFKPSRCHFNRGFLIRWAKFYFSFYLGRTLFCVVCEWVCVRVCGELTNKGRTHSHSSVLWIHWKTSTESIELIGGFLFGGIRSYTHTFTQRDAIIQSAGIHLGASREKKRDEQTVSHHYQFFGVSKSSLWMVFERKSSKIFLSFSFISTNK